MSTAFIALGGVWLDEIHAQGQTTQCDVLGGSVTFATLGARFFLPHNPTHITLVLNAGIDFAHGALIEFQGWHVDLITHWRCDTPSARGVLTYGGPNGSSRSYQRLTDTLSTTWEDLTLSNILISKSFHFFETPEVVQEQVCAILNIRERHGVHRRPLILWEPQSKAMSADSLQRHLLAAQLVDVFSPNHEELAMFFPESGEVPWDPREAERQAQKFINFGIGIEGKGCIVIRAAERGCLVQSRTIPSVWLPAYHTNLEKVKDPTGAGNAFLGGMAIGHIETGNFVRSAMYGHVAASLVIEQTGLPQMTGRGSEERWNAISIRDRLATYEQRVSQCRP